MLEGVRDKVVYGGETGTVHVMCMMSYQLYGFYTVVAESDLPI